MLSIIWKIGPQFFLLILKFVSIFEHNQNNCSIFKKYVFMDLRLLAKPFLSVLIKLVLIKEVCICSNLSFTILILI